MPQSYANYTNISAIAFEFNPRSKDLIARKQEIITSVADHYGQKPTSILFVGFSSLIVGINCKQIFVTCVNEETRKFLDNQGITYTYIDPADLNKHQKQFSWVIASDEY